MKKLSPHPQWALAQKRKGTELRRINGRYYLYEVSSRWDPVSRRSKKITGRLLGKITEKDGFIESEKARLAKQQVKIETVEVKEYGVTALIDDCFEETTKALKKSFPDSWQVIVSLAYGRLLYRSALKNMFFHYSNSYLSERFSDIDLSPKGLSSFLRRLGTSRHAIVEYFKRFKHPGDCILFDGTDIVSGSERMYLPKLGKTKDGTFDNIINLMCVFSNKKQLPVYYRILPGNIKDVRSFGMCLLESGIKDAVVIADKGFCSNDNIMLLEDEGLRFIIPLCRNSSHINYEPLQKADKKSFDGYFRFENRFIWHYSYNHGENKRVVVFFDEELRNREERDYLDRLDKNMEGYSIDMFHSKQHAFGTISVIENTGRSPADVYGDYKTRGQVETMIDSLKNVVEADRTYMHNEQTLEGWMFINHVALQWYYKTLQLLKDNALNGRHSPGDLLMMLSEVKKVKINGQWHDAEITKKTAQLLEKLQNPHIT